MDVYFQHYRIPEMYLDKDFLRTVDALHRAKPTPQLLFRYSPHHSEFIDGGFFPSDCTPAVRGGMTRCILVDEDGSEYVGTATCSLHDNFCYRIGREIAYGRAMAKVEAEEPDLAPTGTLV